MVDTIIKSAGNYSDLCRRKEKVTNANVVKTSMSNVILCCVIIC